MNNINLPVNKEKDIGAPSALINFDNLIRNEASLIMVVLTEGSISN